MAHYVGSGVTAGPHKAIHAGVNTRRFYYELDATATGSTTIAIGKLPGGARPSRFTYAFSATGSVVETVLVTLQGTTLIPTASAGLHEAAPVALGTRLTSSSNIVITLAGGGAEGSGGGQTRHYVIVDYTVEDEPD